MLSDLDWWCGMTTKAEVLSVGLTFCQAMRLTSSKYSVDFFFVKVYKAATFPVNGGRNRRMSFRS